MGDLSRLVALGGPGWLRARFNDLLRLANLPVGEVMTTGSTDKGYVLASLRAGGATHKFEQRRDIATVAWDLRVDNVKTLEHYLQEVQSATALARLSDRTRKRVQLFADTAAETVEKAIVLLNAGVPSHLWHEMYLRDMI